MSLSPYRPVPRWQRVLRSGALGVSVGFHVLLALILLSNPAAAKKASQWVEMTVNQPKPPPPPPPEPEPPKPEPPKPKPPPKTVKFEDIPKTPPPDPTPPPPDPQPRRIIRQVQGLTANSFAPGAATGLQVRAGNTTGVAATKDAMTLDEASGPFQPRPYTQVDTAPHLRWQPTMEVPEEARKAGVEGQIDVRLDLDEKGHVIHVVVLKDLGYGTGDSCAAAWKKSQWKPGAVNGTPVGVTGVPQKCQVIAGA